MARAAGIAGVLLLGACASPYTRSEKWASFREQASLRIEGVPAAEYLKSRCALLVRSALVRQAGVRDGALDIRLDAPPGATCSLGMAVALTRDGYYLTAAHCVSGKQVRATGDGLFVVEKEVPEPPMSVVVTDGREARHGQAFLVWISERGDLALVRSRAAPFGAFERFAEDVAEGDRLLAAGYATLMEAPELADPERYTGPSAGRARGAGPATEEYREVRHDVPVEAGDSGGPLSTPEGALVGVNTRIVGGLFGRGPSVTLQPRWERLRAIIDADRRAR